MSFLKNMRMNLEDLGQGKGAAALSCKEGSLSVKTKACGSQAFM